MYFDGNDHLGRNLFEFFDGNFFVDQTTCAPRHRPINHQGHTPPSLMIDAWVAAKQELQKFLVERRGCRWFLPRFGEKWDDLLLDRNVEVKIEHVLTSDLNQCLGQIGMETKTTVRQRMLNQTNLRCSNKSTRDW
jgi:hypothetical protein